MFRFKQFTVIQEASAMKVGTDGVLLGAWFELWPGCRRVLDVGTGTGLIALMGAQRSVAEATRIDALEIDAMSTQQATENFEASPWSMRLRAINSSLQNFATGFQPPLYDHIVSNPPYFIASLLSPDVRRSTARHSGTLTYDELIGHSVMLLRRGGRISVIVPTEHADQITQIGLRHNLHLTRRTDIYPTDTSPSSKRTMLEMTHAAGSTSPEVRHNTIIIEEGGRHCYSNEYRELTKEFYLKF